MYWLDYLNSIDFKNVIWLIPVILLFHELEEWNILNWYKKNYIDIPQSTNRTIRVWLLGLSLASFIFTAIAYVLPFKIITALMICFLIGFTLQNGLQHLYWHHYFKMYAPGVIFSVIFGIPADIYIGFRMVKENLIPFWVLIIIVILIVPGLVETVNAKNRMTKSVRGAHEIGIRLANKFWA